MVSLNQSHLPALSMAAFHTLISEMHKHTYLDSFMQNIILELLNNTGIRAEAQLVPENFDVTGIKNFMNNCAHNAT